MPPVDARENLGPMVRPGGANGFGTRGRSVCPADMDVLFTLAAVAGFMLLGDSSALIRLNLFLCVTGAPGTSRHCSVDAGLFNEITPL